MVIRRIPKHGKKNWMMTGGIPYQSVVNPEMLRSSLIPTQGWWLWKPTAICRFQRSHYPRQPSFVKWLTSNEPVLSSDPSATTVQNPPTATFLSKFATTTASCWICSWRSLIWIWCLDCSGAFDGFWPRKQPSTGHHRRSISTLELIKSSCREALRNSKQSQQIHGVSWFF